jgi:enterochelin esterase family protein
MVDLAERARRTGTPLVDGDQATFLWTGAERPELIADFNGWGARNPVEFQPTGEGTWAATVTLPRDAYVEYQLRVNGQTGLDPANRRTVSNGLGGRLNYVYMPEAEATPYTRSRAGIAHGSVTRHLIQDDFLIPGGPRTVHLYHPPTDEATPLMVVFDGDDYLKRARLSQIVDNLVAEGRVRPLALAFVNNGKGTRLVEYMCNDVTVGALFKHVLPLAQEHLNLIDVREHPGIHGVCGASMGGLMALYTGVRAPEVFGHVLSQSGSFTFEMLGERMVVRELIERDLGSPIAVALTVGRFEPLLESNEHMADLLREKGYALSYATSWAGHNYTAWRNALPDALPTLYPTDGGSGSGAVER